MKVYKIQDENGLYSTGGQDPDFTQGGKTWSNIGHVKNHLRQFIGGRRLETYAKANIVCIEYTEEQIEKYGVLDFMAALNAQDIADNKYEYHKERLVQVRDKIRGMQEDSNE